MAEYGYYNPDNLVWLLGHANETKVVVEGIETMALAVPNLCPHQGIPHRNRVEDPSTQELDKGCVACWEIGGVSITYKGSVVANLKIPDLPLYNEDVLFWLL